MHHFRVLSLILLSLSLSACQLFKPAENVTQSVSRLQGNLTYTNAQWLFQPCNTQNSYTLKPSAALSEELYTFLAEAPNGLFADLGGHLDTNQQIFSPTQRYRLQIEGHNCDDPDFSRLILRASGNEPFWSILQTPKGLIFNQAGEAAIVLPYIDEHFPDGRFNISSQANNQSLQLWITPQPCIDSMSGTLHHLSAELQWNQQTLHGCAAFGALRD
ncbi:MAG TPA: hypothetical protein GX719_03090 [Gammaproteobacteria bacterium]|nr:hypothetical protein [Gammaproteobacteria bacterium]